MSLTRIANPRDTIGLAEHLRSPGRARVAVVLSCKGSSSEPLFDGEAIDDACGGHADVFILPPGQLGLTFSDQLPPKTTVFGGAARVYPRGRSWLTEPWAAPLVFAYSEDEAKEKIDLVAEKAWALHYDGASTGRGIPRLNESHAVTHIQATPDTAPVPIQVPLLAPKPEAEGLRAEIRELREKLGTAEADAAAARRTLAESTQGYREKLVAARARKQPAETTEELWSPELFDEPEHTVRHAVYLAWVRRVPAVEKTSSPLPPYNVGAGFAASIEKLPAVLRPKAFRCVVDILTDRAKDIPARRVHPLRSGSGTEDQPWTRADGAVCFRANVEAGTAAARRLHWWKLADGSVELCRVVVHDDMEP